VIKPFFDDALLNYLEQAKQLVVGFSGGLDSTVLLHGLLAYPKLKDKILAVHINHGLSTNAAAWEKHCQRFCKQYKILFISHSIQIEQRANLEETARLARHAIFSSYMKPGTVVLLAHHQDDQAETLLLQLFRGAGIDGLSAMPLTAKRGDAEVIRPLLHLSRKSLESYARTHDLSWVEDESNQQLDYSRNYIRHVVMPAIQKNWPAVTSNIARSAEHCQQARQNLEELAQLDAGRGDLNQPTLSIDELVHLPPHRMSNVLRCWLRNNNIRMPSSETFKRLIDELIQAKEDALPLVQWGEVEIRRYQQTLYIRSSDDEPLSDSIPWVNFPEPLVLGHGLGYLVALQSEKGLLLPGEKAEMVIKFRQGGEVFKWRGQSKQLKKCFQQWQVPPWQRDRVPLIYINSELAMVVGYAVADIFYGEQSESAWVIEMATKVV